MLDTVTQLREVKTKEVNMHKETDMNNNVTFEDWCNYRTIVSKIIVANRGGGLGFNVYFEFPQSESEADTRCFGVRLDAAQLEAMG